MSEINEAAYEGSPEAQRKAVDTLASRFRLICNILKFLNASPKSLFDGAPADPEKLSQFYEENFEACISCMMVVDEDIRDLARRLCERLVADPNILASLRKSVAMNGSGFLIKFWKLTYVGTCSPLAESES